MTGRRFHSWSISVSFRGLCEVQRGTESKTGSLENLYDLMGNRKLEIATASGQEIEGGELIGAYSSRIV